MSLRIVAGELGGRRIEGPRGSDVRPTADRVREALFSILGDIGGARVLDLFSGTGALALEALSRGAAHATLVDTDPRLATRNAERLGVGDRVEAVRSDVPRWLGAAKAKFDLVLCDPPYKLADPLADELASLIPPVLDAGARAVTESDPRRPLGLPLGLLTERRYGDTLIRVHGDGK